MRLDTKERDGVLDWKFLFSIGVLLLRSSDKRRLGMSMQAKYVSIQCVDTLCKLSLNQPVVGLHFRLKQHFFPTLHRLFATFTQTHDRLGYRSEILGSLPPPYLHLRTYEFNLSVHQL